MLHAKVLHYFLLALALALTFLLGVPAAFASIQRGDVLVVSAHEAPVFRLPSDSAKTASTLKRGRRIEAAGSDENGFVPTLARSGAKAWIRMSDLTPEHATREKGEQSERRQRSRQGPFGLERLTYDLGASFGSAGSISYTEVEIGFNAYFYKWLAWRNAVFGRFPSKGSSVYGLDSSVRGILDLSGTAGGVTAFAGPGLRFASGSGRSTTPFLEGGVIFKLLGLALGGGVKTLIQSGEPNDTQYFLILAGGGSL